MINEALNTRIENGTLLHAYLISGQRGSGKEELAERMAASMVCSGNGKKPCGVCADCRKAKGGIHPDILRINRDADKKDIRVGQIRDEICATAAVMPNEADRKVYIINEADTMNVQAQNALLKVLEEPPSFVSFILLAENSGAFLETVLSRCVCVKLGGADMAETAESGEGASLAEKTIEAVIKGTPLDIVKLMFEAEKLDKMEFSSFIEAGNNGCIRLMKKTSGSPGKIEVIYSKITREFKKIREYLDYNVNSGHICARLTAALIELQSEK